MARRPQKLATEVQIEWVPMPPEQYHAWVYAMQIITRYLYQAKEIVDAEAAQQHCELAPDTLSIPQPAEAG